MLQAMNTGHEGSLVTVHANSAEESVGRLETLASMSELNIPFESLRDQINSAIDLVVQLSRGSDGVRRITEVAAVASRRREEFRLVDLVRWDVFEGNASEGLTGRTTYGPMPHRLLDRFVHAQETIPHEFLPHDGQAAS